MRWSTRHAGEIGSGGTVIDQDRAAGCLALGRFEEISTPGDGTRSSGFRLDEPKLGDDYGTWPLISPVNQLPEPNRNTGTGP
jgi:hypothetical protein